MESALALQKKERIFIVTKFNEHRVFKFNEHRVFIP